MIKTFLSTHVKTGSALLALFLSISLLLLTACESEPQNSSYYFSGPTMGTQYNITLVLKKEQDLPVPEEQLQQNIDTWLQDFNQIMSTYIPDSELMRLNRAPAENLFKLSPELLSVLSLSEKIHRDSLGSFDVTVGPLVNLWGFGPQGSIQKKPAQADIDAQLQRIGQTKLSIHAGNSTIRKAADVFIDLSAIAKGDGADMLADKFGALGIHRYLIEVGGEIRTKGQSARDKPWRLGIERPTLLHAQSAQQTIDVSSGGIATSGDYRNYFEQNGVRYSHTIDPRTGAPVTHKMASITVIADTAAEADAWATALSVVGPEQAHILAESNQLAIFMIIKTDNGFAESYNSLFAPYLTDL